MTLCSQAALNLKDGTEPTLVPARHLFTDRACSMQESMLALCIGLLRTMTDLDLSRAHTNTGKKIQHNLEPDRELGLLVDLQRLQRHCSRSLLGSKPTLAANSMEIISELCFWVLFWMYLPVRVFKMYCQNLLTLPYRTAQAAYVHLATVASVCWGCTISFHDAALQGCHLVLGFWQSSLAILNKLCLYFRQIGESAAQKRKQLMRGIKRAAYRYISCLPDLRAWPASIYAWTRLRQNHLTQQFHRFTNYLRSGILMALSYCNSLRTTCDCGLPILVQHQLDRWRVIHHNQPHTLLLWICGLLRRLAARAFLSLPERVVKACALTYVVCKHLWYGSGEAPQTPQVINEFSKYSLSAVASITDFMNVVKSGSVPVLNKLSFAGCQ